MAVTQVDIDQDALARVMALSGARTKKDAINVALDAKRLHQAEKNAGS